MPSLINTAMTLGSARRSFELSNEFRSLASATQRNYREALQRLSDLDATPLQDIRRAAILSHLDALGDRPGAACIFLTASKRFWRYAIEREWADHNPVTGLRAPKLGEHRRWEPDEVRAFLEGASPHVRIGILLALYTGQRLSDVVRMKWSDIEEGFIHVVQQKTGTALVIPIHDTLRKSLDDYRDGVDGGYIIGRNDSAGPWSPSVFRARYNRDRARLGLCFGRDDAPVYHGIRKTAAALLAEGGASTREIMAIGGWKRSAQVDLYTKQADQRALAVSAMSKMGAV
jgi:integrase